MTIATANTNPIFQVEPRPVGADIADTDTTTQITVLTAGDDGYLIDSISCYSTDTSTATIKIEWNDGAVDHPIGVLTVPVGAGTDGVIPAYNLLDPTMLVLQSGGGFALPAGGILKLSATVTLTAAKQINFTVNGGDY